MINHQYMPKHTQNKANIMHRYEVIVVAYFVIIIVHIIVLSWDISAMSFSTWIVTDTTSELGYIMTNVIMARFTQ